ncbi:hypothetical protein KUV95_14885 [Microbulbifer agarilyticus]|uniref:hypothetical protein n=1 Tax=Microbulbifer agarilyticus TaxID=260552 RepID=UPI001C98934E|nr:hypothetical protein [Microbulbifer agarilyticus]MBY6212841.1 hypothetical protein [Microbulbifer agarilyticus]
MVTASKALMIFEGLILAYLSFLGILLIIVGIIPFLYGGFASEYFAGFVTSLMLLAFLVAGWRIYFWVLLGSFGTRRHISKYWLVLSAIAVFVSLLSLPLHKLSEASATNIWYTQSQFFMFGLFFLPTAAHLVLHIYLEKNANKHRQ